MTPQERAEPVLNQNSYSIEELREFIRVAIVEATNDELMAKRQAEARARQYEREIELLRAEMIRLRERESYAAV